MFISGRISLGDAHDSLSSPSDAGVEVEKEQWSLFWNLPLRKYYILKKKNLIISQYFINNQFLMIFFFFNEMPLHKCPHFLERVWYL